MPVACSIDLFLDDQAQEVKGQIESIREKEKRFDLAKKCQVIPAFHGDSFSLISHLTNDKYISFKSLKAFERA